jgi:outer membrane biosynthesis protein TonB
MRRATLLTMTLLCSSACEGAGAQTAERPAAEPSPPPGPEPAPIESSTSPVPAPSQPPEPAPPPEPSTLDPNTPGDGMPITDADTTKLRAQVLLHKPIVSAGLQSASIVEVVESHLDELRACYEASLRQRAGLTGDVTLTLTVGSSGQVSSASMSAALDPALARCFARAAKRWQFPTPENGGVVGVEQPMSLVPG